MGPMFSCLIFVIAVALIWAVTFACARFFQPIVVAVRLAALFAIGAVAGAVLFAVALTLFIGASGTLTSS